ncbi:MAG: ATP-binding protein [Pseudomonadota bacterium]
MIPISEDEIQEKLRFDNPWWESGETEKRFSQLPRRSYFDPFFELLANRSLNRAVILMGPRRVGKTVLVYHAIEKLLGENIPRDQILYLSLETPLYTGLTLERVVSLFVDIHAHNRNSALYIFFDEIQYHKNWEVHLKSLVDSYPEYKFIATGSAAAALKLKSQESGAGRFTDFLLPPLTFAEYLRFTEIEPKLIKKTGTEEAGYDYDTRNINELNLSFIDYLNFGGYPEAVFSESVRSDAARYIKSDIIDKVLLRDLPALYGISDIQELNKLFTTLAYNSAQEISLEQLSQGAGISKNTLKRYLEYLEAAFLIKIVHRVDDNAKKLKRATTFKVYLTNPSMRAALFGPIDMDSDAMGALTETAIYAQWFHSSNIDKLHYARWKGGEVDIVYVTSAEMIPGWCVEVKWSDLPYTDTRKLSGVLDFIENNHIDGSLVTTKTMAGTKIIRNREIEYVPSALYAYCLGANIQAAKAERQFET